MELDFSNDIIEKLLLKRALTDKHWINVLSKTYDKRWFKTLGLSQTIRNIIKFYEKHNSIPNIQTIFAITKMYIEKYPDCGFKLSDIQQLMSEVSNLNLNISDEIINSNIKEFIRRNAFYNSLYDNAELLEKSPDNYAKVVDKCLENFDKVLKITFNDTDLGLDYFDSESMERHWDFINNPEAKIKTLWSSLDTYTNGGFLKDGKMLALFMAQAGLGKSVFLSNLGVNFLKLGLGVVVISLEMSQDVYATRFDAHISQNNINRLKETLIQSKQRIKDFYKSYPSANLYLKEYPPRSICSKDIEQYLENLKNAGKKFDVIIIDYLNLVLPNHQTDSMFKDGLAVSEELRALSYKFGCPVISAVQCNTEGMSSAEIDMLNVSESRGIVHTVDAMFALYQLDEDRENGIINLKVVKNRLGGMVGKHSSFKLDPENLNLNDITFDGSYVSMSNDDSLGNLISNLPNISSDIDKI